MDARDSQDLPPLIIVEDEELEEPWLRAHPPAVQVAAQQAAEEQPATQPGEDQPPAEEAAAQPAIEQQPTQHPADEEPATDQPSAEEHGFEEAPVVAAEEVVSAQQEEEQATTEQQQAPEVLMETTEQPAAKGLPALKPLPLQPVAPEFPSYLPHVDINTVEFEQGLPQECVVGGADSTSICTVCGGYPRHPATLYKCGHMFCEPCIKQWFKQEGRRQAARMPRKAPCPNCRRSFVAGQILSWDQWQAWAQLAFNAKEVMCPWGCGFKGTACEVDDHQLYHCKHRTLNCPVDGCFARGEAEWVEHEHFPQCPLLEVFCPTCRLPVRMQQLRSHHCMARLWDALQGTLPLSPYNPSCPSI